MLNYLLFLHNISGNSDPALGHIWEILCKQLCLYQRLGGNGQIVTQTAALVRDGRGQHTELLGQISERIGVQPRWRLVLFYAQPSKTLASFLCRLMDPGDPGLSCARPEQIWMVTVVDRPDVSDPTGSNQYTKYPSNCRFLQYGIDFHEALFFEREALLLHSGLATLMCNEVPVEALPAYHTCQLQVDIDWSRFLGDVGEYRQRLEQMKEQFESQSVGLPYVIPLTERSVREVKLEVNSFRDVSVPKPEQSMTAEEIEILILQMEQNLRFSAQRHIHMQKASAARQLEQVDQDLKIQGQRSLDPDERAGLVEHICTYEKQLFDQQSDGMWQARRSRRHAAFIKQRKADISRELEKIEEFYKASPFSMRKAISIWFFTFLCLGTGVSVCLPGQSKATIFLYLLFAVIAVLLVLCSYKYCANVPYRCAAKYVRQLYKLEVEQLKAKSEYLRSWVGYLRLLHILHYSDQWVSNQRLTHQSQSEVFKQELDISYELYGQMRLIRCGGIEAQRLPQSYVDVDEAFKKDTVKELFLFSVIQNGEQVLLNQCNAVTPAFAFVKAVRLVKCMSP